MKKIFLPLLALATLVGCSKKDVTTDDSNRVAIKLSAGVPKEGVQPKAPVESGVFTAAVAGWESNTGSATYTNPITWESTADVTASASAANITLSPEQNYNADGTILTYIKAWYPAGTLTNGVVSFTNAAAEEDVLLATEVKGSKSDKSDKTLAFTHKTTQFKFVVKEGSGLAASTTIDKITLVGAEIPTGFNLADNTLNYAAAANLDVPGITAGALVIGVTPAGDAAGRAVMVKTQTGKELTLNVVTSNAQYDGVKATIDTDDNFVEGKAYTITLTFGQAGIDLSAIVAPWTTGTGSGSLE